MSSKWDSTTVDKKSCFKSLNYIGMAPVPTWSDGMQREQKFLGSFNVSPTPQFVDGYQDDMILF
jgi:hypothetical protein